MTTDDPTYDEVIAAAAPPAPVTRPDLDALIESAVVVERERQIALGYDEKHDDGHVPDHLAYWAQEYRRKGEFIKALALWRAYDESVRRQTDASNARMREYMGREAQSAAPTGEQGADQ